MIARQFLREPRPGGTPPLLTLRRLPSAEVCNGRRIVRAEMEMKIVAQPMY